MTQKPDLLQGTLDMLVMRALADEALHGYALVHRLNLISGGRLSVPQGSLYPALHRLENQGVLKGEWRDTASGREAKFHRLTAKGRYGLSPHDPAMLATGTALLLVVGLVGALMPAVRASRIDPIDAIRAE